MQKLGRAAFPSHGSLQGCCKSQLHQKEQNHPWQQQDPDEQVLLSLHTTHQETWQLEGKLQSDGRASRHGLLGNW